MSYLANHRAFYSSSMAMKEGYKIFLSTLQPILRRKIPLVIVFTQVGWRLRMYTIQTIHCTFTAPQVAGILPSTDYSQPGWPKLFSLSMATAFVGQ